MQRSHKVFLVFWVWLAVLLLACERRKPAPDGRVVAVKDGDTIEILELGKAVTVRLAEVDAPEKNQDFGTQAKKFTSDLVFGKEVRLVRQDTDRYGRIVARVYLPDGRCLNEELVSQGYAWHYKAYSKDPTLARMETDARMYRRGLWAMPNPTAPWDFRKNKRANQTGGKPASGSGIDNSVAANMPVWVCSSKTVKFFHLRQNCPRLVRCGNQVVALTKAQADALGKSRKCSVCG